MVDKKLAQRQLSFISAMQKVQNEMVSDMTERIPQQLVLKHSLDAGIEYILSLRPFSPAEMRTFQLINRVNPESSYANYKALLVMMK